MSLHKVVRFGCLAVVTLFSVAALGVSSRASLEGLQGSGFWGSDILSVGKITEEKSIAPTAEQSDAETLVNWEFTGRERPAKCRFGS